MVETLSWILFGLALALPAPWFLIPLAANLVLLVARVVVNDRKIKASRLRIAQLEERMRDRFR